MTILRNALLLFAVFTLGVFSAENRIVSHLTSKVLILGPRGDEATELDGMILDDVCRVRRLNATAN